VALHEDAKRVPLPRRREKHQRVVVTLAAEAAALAEAGADLLVIETQSDLREIEQAVEGARQGAPGTALMVCATFTRDDVQHVLDRTQSGRVATAVGAISIESPVRRQRGEVFDLEAMRQVSALARDRGIALHLDGARLFVAAAYSGRPLAEYTTLFDTVYVSLWKCFNSGGGAILAGPRALLAEMYQARRMFGGALWNAWPYAAVASHYAEGYLERLTAAVRNSEALFTALAALPGFEVVRVAGGTSVVRLNLRGGDPARFRERLRSHGITLAPPDGAGFWLRVNETVGTRRAGELASAFAESLAG
jgi:threonine aldolase